MHLFGLTGGIASGKSAVAARFRARGVPVVDADQLARDVVLPGTPGLAAVVEAFGAGVLDADGALDRKRLGELVFKDEAARRTLNALLHPRIAQAGVARAAELAARGEPLACYEAALLVENGLADAFRPLVVVAASPAVQAARVGSRDALDREAALARIAAQMPLEDKVRAADLVITNEGTVEALTSAADDALREVLTRTSVDPARYFSRDPGAP
jgi:dephospho-CoA kinase